MNNLQKGLGLGLALGVILVAFLVHHFWHPSINPLPPPPDPKNQAQPEILDFDAFQARLAEQVSKEFGGGPGNSHFTVAVVPVAYDVGTLFNDHDWVPVSSTRCKPRAQPGAQPAAHMFSSYSISSATALQASLGSAALQELTNASASVGLNKTFDYSIDNVTANIMDDDSVDEVTSRGECGGYIASHPGARLVRGALSGKITFKVNVDDPASFKAEFAKIGEVNISDDPANQRVAVSDNQSEQIVVLLTQFESSADGSARLIQNVVTPTPSRSPASEGDVAAHVYVQQDATDATNSGAKIVAALASAWQGAKIETKVERVPTQRMPDKAQVRFFNASDLEMANKCRDFLKPTNLDAKVVRVGLPAPSGHLEVWLPKVKSSNAP